MGKECKDHLGNVYGSISDMCKFYGIRVQVFYKRRKKGWSLEQCLFGKREKCVDHKGNVFETQAEMCDYYEIPVSTFITRITRSGWSLEEALTIPLGYKTPIKDHLGNEYPSVEKLCKAYGISRKAFDRQKKQGFSLEDILLEKVPVSTQHFDHKGNCFSSLKEMCDYYKISIQTFYRRQEKGWDLQQILETNLWGQTYDHKGTLFPSLQAKCTHYNISTTTYRNRIKSGMSEEEALTTEVKNNRGIKCYDFKGIEHKSEKAMCKFYGMDYSAFRARIESGWNLEEALTIPRNMYIGEYKVAECLKRFNVKFYHDCSIKKIFKDLNVNVDWDAFLSELKDKLEVSGIKWSKSKIEKLRPDFTLYTSDDNKIIGVIEFDGEQHQNFVEYFFKTIEEFLRRSNTDFVKQGLWEYLNIPMLRIRYDQVDMIEDMVKDLLNNPNKYLTNHNTYLSEDEYWEPLRETKEKLDMAFAA